MVVLIDELSGPALGLGVEVAHEEELGRVRVLGHLLAVGIHLPAQNGPFFRLLINCDMRRCLTWLVVTSDLISYKRSISISVIK